MALASTAARCEGTEERPQSPTIAFSNKAAFDVNTQDTKHSAAFKDLTLDSSQQPNQDMEVDPMDVSTDNLSNGVHPKEPPVNGVAQSDFASGNLPSAQSNPSSIVTSSQNPDTEPTGSDPSFSSTLDSTIEQPTSHLRDDTHPLTREESSEITTAKYQQDLAKDPELANGIAEGGNLPIERNGIVNASLSPMGQAANGVLSSKLDSNIKEATPPKSPIAANLPDIELPHHPAFQPTNGDSSENPVEPPSTPALQSSSSKLPLDQDQIMQDVHFAPKSPGKVVREREEDGDGRPAAKRTRTDLDASATPEFKIPEIPQNNVQDKGTSHDTASLPTESKPSSSKIPELPRRDDFSEAMTKPQRKALHRILTNLRKTKDSIAFNLPVDPIALKIPTYPEIIKEPMDLKTMDENMKSNKYNTINEFLYDFELIVKNSATFNGFDHPISASATRMQGSLGRQLSELPGPEIAEPVPADKKAKKPAPTAKIAGSRRESRSSLGGNAKSPTTATSPTTFALGPTGVPLIRRDSTVNDGRPKREIHPPAPRDLPYSNQKPKKKKYQLELRFCAEVLNEMKKPKNQTVGWAFAMPVDPVALNIPNYHSVIKKPMDISTIDKKLSSGQYETAKEFEADIRLMFNNCYKFNPPGHNVYTNGKAYERIFEEKWGTKKQWLADHAPASTPQSPGTSPEPDEEDDDDEDEDDDPDDQLTLLQKQIAAMSEQVKAIQKKKASPPAPSRKGSKVATKPKKKESKKSAPSAPAKADKKNKPVKKEKVPYVTYEQKQDISSRINNLPAQRMATALTIIRDNMPNLKGVQEDEIELDIDELSNEVLYKLLGFVRKYAPRPEDAEPVQVKSRSNTGMGGSGSTTQHGKKNKPMSKNEQEAKIRELQGKLSGFAGQQTQSPEPEGIPSEETSGDEDDSEESEED
ncbi:hypothetical protein MMC25_006005 [Agyrium rufum]|nr:hypothetical protein [Agyrium rufum]